jgi:predicted dehydrogenase
MASPAATSPRAAARPGAGTELHRSAPQPKPVRVAVLGLGYWGPNLLRNFHEVIGDDLRACCDRDETRVHAARARYPRVRATCNADDILAADDIDAVAIATPVSTHYGLAKAALQAGKSVLIEKPMTADPGQAEELVDLAARRGRILMVDHVFVFSPPVRKIKELLDRGELGRLLYVDSVRINLGLFQRDVNVVWDLAPHDLSIVDYLLGRMPKSVAAFGSVHTGSGHEDVAYLNLDFGDGLIANFHVNWLSPVKIRYTMLGGSRKSLVYNDLDPVETIKVYDSGVSVRRDDLEDRRNLLIDYRTGDVWSPRLEPAEPLRAVVGHFVACVQTGQTPVTDGQAGLRVVRVLDAAQRSIKAQGGRITL